MPDTIKCEPWASSAVSRAQSWASKLTSWAISRIDTRPPAEIPDTGLVPAEDDADETMVVAADDLAELEPVHVRVAASRSVLAGPTLDDVMSRVWEGLRAEVPTPCPVCHTEIEPSAHGRCGACGSILD